MKTQSAGYGWEWFNITILDAKTGAILATSSSPSFDPNLRNVSNYLDLAISSPYEPGSIFKSFTAAIGIDTDEISLSDTYDDK